MTISVGPIGPEAFEAWFNAIGMAFLESFDAATSAEAFAPHTDFSRVLAARDGDAIVGTYRSWPTEVTVPGGRGVPAGAVTAVTVRATHRRQGLLREMIARDRTVSVERGEALRYLIAAEWPIYGRFGFGPATESVTWTVDKRMATLRGRPRGSVALVSPEQAREILPVVYDAGRPDRVGEVRRLPIRWDRDLSLVRPLPAKSWTGWVVVHRDDAGTADGYVRYSGESKWDGEVPKNFVTVDDLHATNDDAYDALWSYLLSIDLVGTVTASARSVAERLPWLLVDARAARQTERHDFHWVELVDPAAALEARTYERTDRLVLELVADPRTGAPARQRLELDASPDGARCRPSRRSPDLTLHTAAMGAAYLGGTRLSHAAIAAGWDEHTPGALARAESLLRTVSAPWGSTFF